MDLSWSRIKEKFRTEYRPINFIPAKMELGNKILIGTHHKTGTNWMRRVFGTVARKFQLNYHYGIQDDLPADFEIFFENHSKFNLSEMDFPYRGLHLIRDPRDRIVSGCFYHLKATESWLHIKKKEFGGLTYQEKINSYSSLDDRMLFEMENSAKTCINDMRNWDYSNDLFLNVKYEDLISDRDLYLFHKIFCELGVDANSLPHCLRISWQNSLFSGNHSAKSKHIRSGSSAQWVKYFKPMHKKRFIELFDDALIVLNYEIDNGWAD